MIVYRFPPQAAQEQGYFSVVGQLPDGKTSGEILIVPRDTLPEVSFDGVIIHYPNTPSPSALPISTNTLLPLSLAAQYPENPVCVCSHITSNTLKAQLSEAIATYGARLWFLVSPFCDVYPLPCPPGGGKRISRTASAILRSERSGLYTDAFCCNYCAPVSPVQSLHLYDTQQTVEKKLALAQLLGIKNALVFPLWDEDDN